MKQRAPHGSTQVLVERAVTSLAAYVWPIRRAMPRAWWSLMIITMPLLLALLPPHRSAVATIRRPMRVLISAPRMEQARAAGGSGKAAVKSRLRQKPKSAPAPSPVTTMAPVLSVAEGTFLATPPPEPEAEDGASAGVGSGGSESGHGHGQGEGNGVGDGDESGKTAKKVLAKMLPPQPRSRTWSCEWPLFTKVKDATVVVKIAVDEHGYAEEVAVVQATHEDFVKITVQCAMNKRYHPARDADGKAVSGVTEAWPVHYILYGAEVDQ